MGSGPTPSFTPDNAPKKGPTPSFVPDAQEVKKKDVAGPSQTSPSTPSPSGQMPGFAQSRKWDVNAVPSTSPSTPQPAANKPAQLPQFIYNNNLNTGTKPSVRGYQYNEPKPVDDRSLAVKFLDYVPDVLEPMMGSAPAVIKNITAPETIAYNLRVQDYESRRLVASKNEFENSEFQNANVRANTPGTPEYQTKVAAQYPGVAVAPVVQERNTLDKARAFSDWYLLNTNPSAYNDLKKNEQNYSQEWRREPGIIQSAISPTIAPALEYSNELMLQKARATSDIYALNLYSKASAESFYINKKELDNNYGAQKLAYDSAYDTLMAWPKDADGIYIANTSEEQTKLSETMNTYKLLIADEGFVSAMMAVKKDQKDIADAKSALSTTIKENHLYFIAQDKAKKRSAEKQARLSKLGPVFEWKAKNIDNPAAMAIVDATMGFAYLHKACGDGDEFSWTDDVTIGLRLGQRRW